MDKFSLTEEQEMFRASVRQLAEEKVAPRAEAIDEAEEFPEDMFEIFKKNDLLGIGYPENVGGSGGALEFVILGEELSRVSASVAMIPLLNKLGTTPVSIAGSDAQKKEILGKVVRGEAKACYALTEPEAGSDPASMVSRAVRDGDGWIINGTKRFISNSGPAQINTFFAVTDPGGKRGKNITCFLVDRDKPGYEVGRKEHKLGLRGSPTAEVILNDYRASDGDIVGELNGGYAIAMRTLDFSRPNIAAQAVGIAQGAFDAALAYAKERKQFGQPIIRFQGIEWMFADMAMKIEASRLLVYRCAEAITAGDPKVSYYAAVAKCFAADSAMSVTTDCVQILGGYGYVKEFPVERYMRDAKITQIYEGTNQIQRIVIGREIQR